jgi:hypothetical protein
MLFTVIRFFAGALLAGLTLTAGAQAPEPEATPDESKVSAPSTMAGTADTLRRAPSSQNTNILGGELSFTTLYTDNAELTATQRISDVTYRFEPSLNFQQIRSRTTVAATGSLGVIANQHLQERNEFTTNLSGDLGYRLTEYTNIRFSDTFLNTTGLVADANRQGTGIGLLQRPNTSSFNYAHVRSNSVLAELSHQAGPNTTFGFRGSQSSSWYPNTPSDPGFAPLYGTRSATAEGFLNHRISLRHWTGVSLRARRFTIGGDLGETNAASALFFYSFVPTPNTTLSFFGGPEFSNTFIPERLRDVTRPFDRRVWGPAAGATFTWLAGRTSTTASFVRQVSDGGGLSSAVTLYSAEAGVRRQIARRNEVEFDFGFSQNTPLVPGDSTQVYSGRVRWFRQINNSWTAQLVYGRDQHGAAVGQPLARANQVFLTIAYHFTRGVGR